MNFLTKIKLLLFCKFDKISEIFGKPTEIIISGDKLVKHYQRLLIKLSGTFLPGSAVARVLCWASERLPGSLDKPIGPRYLGSGNSGIFIVVTPSFHPDKVT